MHHNRRREAASPWREHLRLYPYLIEERVACPLDVDRIYCAFEVSLSVDLPFNPYTIVKEHCSPERDHELRHRQVFEGLRVNHLGVGLEDSKDRAALAEGQHPIERPIPLYRLYYHLCTPLYTLVEFEFIVRSS